MSECKLESNGGCGGCLIFCISVIIVWALLFGVTIGGVHYGLGGCDPESGVTIDTGR